MKKKIVMLRSSVKNTASDFYGRAFERYSNDIEQIYFDPHGEKPSLRNVDADIVILVDCGLPVDFDGMGSLKCEKWYVSIDSCHKLEIHQAYVKKYGFSKVWVAQKHVATEFWGKGVWLPLAADKHVHAYRPEMADDRLIDRIFRRSFFDIGMCGAPYPHRRMFEAAFKKAGLKTNFYFRKKFGEGATREISKCTIGFNVGAGFDGKKGYDIPMRVFETMLGGQAALLTNTYSDLGYEELFSNGTHYLTYDTVEQAVDIAGYYSVNTLEAIEIARNGQRLVFDKHTYDHRVREMLDAI